jgi:hypothetical protein
VAHPALAGLNGVDWVDVRIIEELSFLGQERGYSTPSRQYLANIIGCTVRTITRHLTKLCRLGYLQRQLRTHRTADGKIRNRTNLYRVALDQAARIKAFFSALGRGKSGGSTGRTSVPRKPKAENNIQLQKDTFPVSEQKKQSWRIPETWSEAWKYFDPLALLKPSTPLSEKEQQQDIKPAFQRFANLGVDPQSLLKSTALLSEKEQQPEIKPQFQRFANLGKGQPSR